MGAFHAAVRGTPSGRGVVLTSVLGLFFLAARGFAAEPIITTIAGAGPDHIPATQASIWSPVGLAPDPSGGFFISASEANRIYRVDSGGRVSIVAGAIERAGFAGDGGPSAAGRLRLPDGIARVGGNLYFSDTGNQRVRRVDAVTGVITTVAGDGTAGYAGDGGPASAARLNKPRGLAADAAGRLYIADQLNQRIRRIDFATGLITTVAGTGFGTGQIDGPGGDPRDDFVEGGPAASASVRGPAGLAFDAAGSLFIVDTGNVRIRRVDAFTGTITTVAGNGHSTGDIDGPGGNPTDDFRDGVPATATTLRNPSGVTVSADGDVVIADTDNQRVRGVSATTGIIQTIAGTGFADPYGNGGPATAAALHGPLAVCYDAHGDLLIADSLHNFVRRVDAGGIISVAAGNAFISFSGDGTLALSGQGGPRGLALDAAGNLFFASSSRVRRIDAVTGIVTTIAGNGSGLTSGDGGPALLAGIRDPQDVALDAAGNIYIANQFEPRIRKVDAATGVIITVAGNGVESFSGDGGPATLAAINRPVGLTVDGPGNIFIADRYNGRIRRVDAATGVITTIAGIGIYGFGGDGGPATAAILGLPVDVAFDNAGNLLISDQCNHRIRRIDRLTGMITTIAGNGPGAVSGDGCRTNTSALMNPMGIRVDAAGNLFVADLGGAAIRRFDAVTGAMTTVAGNGVFDLAGDGGPATAASLLGPADVAVDPAGHLLIADANRLRRVGQDTPPIADAGPDLQEECISPLGAGVHLDGSASSDADSSPGTGDDILSYDWVRNDGLPSRTWLGSGPVTDAMLPLGDATVTLRVIDRAGLMARDTAELRVRDTTPPAITVGAAPDELWPPNHRLVPVHAAVTVSDLCSAASVRLDAVSSSEPDDAPGPSDGTTLGDVRDAAAGAADFDLLLRAERDRTGTGRTYTLSYRAVDGAGNAATAAASVVVPLDHSGQTDPLNVQVDAGPSGLVIGWDAVSGAGGYSVVRARLSDVARTADATSLGTVLCAWSGAGATTTAGSEDPEDPPMGDAFLYLVQYSAGGWSGYGSESGPLPVEPASGDCP